MPKKQNFPPRNLRILGRQYAIHPQPVESEWMEPTSLGECHPYDRAIHIREFLPLSELQDTFLHEVLHAIAWHSQLGLSHKHEERAVGVLASGLIAVIRDNPEFLKYLSQDFNKSE